MEREFVLKKLNELIYPIVEKIGYELYFIEYVEEEGENYLRIYIDNDEGVTLQDCEKVSRAVGNMLDVEDPIPESYYLEVSSPGIYRVLFTDEHLKRYIGSMIEINFNNDISGAKKIIGKLLEFNDTNIKICKESSELEIPRKEIKNINLEGSLKEVSTNE